MGGVIKYRGLIALDTSTSHAQRRDTTAEKRRQAYETRVKSVTMTRQFHTGNACWFFLLVPPRRRVDLNGQHGFIAQGQKVEITIDAVFRRPFVRRR